MAHYPFVNVPPLFTKTLLAASCWVAAPAFAQNDVNTLGQVEVVGRINSNDRKAFSSEYVVTRDEIQRRGADTLDRILALVPGLNVRVGADGTPRIDIRGQRTRQVLLRVNGVPFNAAGDGQFDPTFLDAALISEVRVQLGTSSVLYGENGTAGVINVITKKGSSELTAGINAQQGSGQDQRLGASVSGKAEQLDYVLTLGQNRRANFALSNAFTATPEQDSLTRRNSDNQRDHAYVNLGFTPNVDWKLGLTVNTLTGENGRPSSVINNPSDVFAQRPQYQRNLDINNMSFQLASDYQMTSDTVVKAWLYSNQQQQTDVRYDDARLLGLTNDTVRGTYRLNNDNLSKGFHLQFESQVTRDSRLAIAFDERNDRYGQTGVIRDIAIAAPPRTPPGGGGGGGGVGGGGPVTAPQRYALRNVNTNNDISIASVSAEWNERWGDRLKSVVGIGAIKETISGGLSNTTPIGNAALAYVASDQLDIRLSAARKVRAPSVSQRYDSVNGNLLLKPEQTTTVELGFRHRLPGDGLGELTFFRTSAQDFIDNDPTTNIASNRSRLVFSGLEIAVKQRISANWLLLSGYSFLDAKDESAGADTTELQYRPRHKLTLDSALELTPELLWSSSASLVAGQVVLSRTMPTRSMDVAQIALFATRLQWRANRQVTLDAGIDNLFDRNYETSYAFPQRGRFTYVGADFRF